MPFIRHVITGFVAVLVINLAKSFRRSFLGQNLKKQWAVVSLMSVYWNLGQKKLETTALGSISAPDFIAIHLI